jgi:tRNA modification GTPase
VDTAGLRESSDIIERHGVEISRRYLDSAHVVLLCEDSPDELAASLAAVRSATAAPLIAVETKSDLRPAGDSRPRAPDGERLVRVSVLTRHGLAELLSVVQDVLDAHIGAVTADAPILTRARHETALRRAREEIESFRAAWDAHSVPSSIAAVHTRTAVQALEELIGGVDADAVLARVFAAFCVGK